MYNQRQRRRADRITPLGGTPESSSGDMCDLDPDSKKLVEQELSPAKQKTHRATSNLKHSRH